MENPPVEQQSITPTETPKVSLLQRLGNVLRSALESLDTRTKRYSLEDLGRPEIVAQVILGQIGNPLRERFGRNPWKNGFSLVTLLSNMGHPPLITSQDYFKNLSGEGRERYLTLRQTLRQLSARETDPQELKVTKPLLESQLEKPDAYRETVLYKVVNEKLLREMV